MKEKDLNKLKALVKDARRLEILIAEIERNLTEQQEAYLDQEVFCMGNISKAPMGEIVSHIDCALHHSEEYPKPEFEDSFNGDVESIYTALCIIKDKWKKLFEKRKVNTTHAFIIFNQWVDQVYKYTEYLNEKYSLGLRTLQITNSIYVYGLCYHDEARIKYNIELLLNPEHAIRVIIHELSHLKYSGHKKDFWQFYEDICINEGVLLERVLGNNERFDDIKGSIPYKWPMESKADVLSEREEKVIDKFLRLTQYFRKSCTAD